MTVDRTPTPCDHRVNHQCGTLVKYKLDRCRCYPCVLAANNHEVSRIRAKAYGRSTTVPPDKALHHVTMLRSQGWTSKHIAAQAGVATDTISRLTGPRIQKRIARSVEERILALHPDQGEKTDLVPTIGSSRRLRALGTLGWTANAIATRAGLSKDTILRIRQVEYDTMLAATQAKISAVYAQLWDVPAPVTGGSSRMRTRAQRLGYAPPMAWDDDDLDDPTAEPDYGSHYAPITDDARERFEAFNTEFRALIANGRTGPEAAADMGLSVQAAYKRFHRGAPQDPIRFELTKEIRRAS